MRKTFAPAALNAIPEKTENGRGQVGFVCTAQKKTQRKSGGSSDRWLPGLAANMGSGVKVGRVCSSDAFRCYLPHRGHTDGRRIFR